MTSDLGPILARVPLFQDADAVRVTELGGGITNRNYKIETGGQAYVLRVGGKDTGLLGIDRQVEYGCTQAASRVGVAPEPVAFLEPEGYLVTRFVEGRGVPPEEVGREPVIGRVVASLKLYHAIDRFPGSFSPFRVAEAYERVARERRAPLPPGMSRFLDTSAEIERTLLRHPFVPRPCHNDLLNGNFIDDGDRIRILDWEYAGMGDFHFDLGNLAAQHEFSDAQDEALLQAYFGAPSPSVRARHKLMKAMSDLREAMWAMVQVTVSTLEFDYLGYRQKYFDRFEAAARGDRFRQWLRDAGG